MTKNVFVVGLDDFNHEVLRQLPDAGDYRFHQLLDLDELMGENIDFDALLDSAQRQLEKFDGPIDAIVGYWDFPVSSLVPLLCERFGLPAASLEAVAKCEHKYWSRLEQSKVIEEYPAFATVDLDHDTNPPGDLRYPLWLKPVKSYSSKLAFRVDSDEAFTEAVDEIKAGVAELGGPFEAVLNRLTLPPEIAEAGGQACLAEEAVEGAQITVEGFSYRGEPRVYGIIDSVNYPESPSFLRYQYPSVLPEHLLDRVSDVSVRLVRHLGLDNVAFNIEYFVDVEEGKLWVLEVNPRHSQSHARLFEEVDGVPNHHYMLELGLGREPRLIRGEGNYPMAAKCFLRRFTDGVVRRVPTEEEVAEVQRELPGVAIEVTTEEGVRLAEQQNRDSYSFELADVHIGANSQRELTAKYEQCVEHLRFEIEDVEEADNR
ncbi:ATP-grasp domain-containing protein [Prauserella shujinwangii]|uniref:ATP-grasp domain-containing protein n=1 Tax=Prauserella shujinwangii TaxID=1453103 RepID=A0A2T0LR09_9PSEU|nr:ATP-grasp domain-containing protein [Prauserella shujinwangii]PRX45941.1 ATP-grasp domain-containing protein [Prauserella shujinwangii]